MGQIDASLNTGALAQHLMHLQSMLPELTTKVLETRRTCDEAVRALSSGSLADTMSARTIACDKASVSTVIRGRQARAKFMPENWFSDPAWDILLHLYEAHLDDVERTVGDLGSFAVISPATTNRWLDVLYSKGWIHRRRCEHDQRRVFITLSESGAGKMRAYFEHLRQPAVSQA